MKLICTPDFDDIIKAELNNLTPHIVSNWILGVTGFF